MKWVLTFIFLCTLATSASAEEFNAGIVQGLWYSQENIFADEPVRIYVAIRNNTGSDLTGTVEFLDNGKRIDSTSVSALDGRIIERWADWTPKAGEHTITATLSRTKLHTVGANSETVTVTAALAEDILLVDYDTDGDGVGNQTDVDDDGDGISDEVETTNGTDPLKFDAPTPEPVSSSKETTGSDSEAVTRSTTTPEGIERYLTPSRAETMLGGITNLVNESKEKLDTYRQARAVENGTAEPVIEAIEVNADGFGEITRTTDKDQSAGAVKKPKVKAQKPDGLLGDIFSFVGSILNGIYTGFLAVISYYLGHPIIVQLSILIFIILGLYKISQRIGRRPQ